MSTANENGAREEKKTHLKWFGIPRILPYTKPYRKRMALMLFLGFLSSLTDSAYPLFNRHMIDVNIAGRTLQGFAPMIIGYLAVLGFQVWNNYYTALTCSRMELYMNRDLRNAAFGHLQTLSFSYFNQNSVGWIHARVMSDSGRIGELVSWQMMDFTWSGAYVVCVAAVMLMTHARLALLTRGLTALAAAVTAVFRRRLVEQNRKVRELNSAISGDFNEGITGVRAIKTLNVEKRMEGDFEKRTGEMKTNAVRAARTSTAIGAAVSLVSALALSLVVWKGGEMTRDRLMEIGTLSVFMSYAISIMDPLQNCINVLTSLTTIQVNIERFTSLMDTVGHVTDTPEVIEKYGDTFNPRRENWEPIRGDVTFDDVTFKYPDGDEHVLEHFSLDVKAGSSVAIVGETGAGKTTLVNLVCRFYEPTEGRVLIDGRDARERSQLWLHSSIGYVLQTPHLFSGTVRDNLRYGRPDATDEEIMEKLRMVNADKVLEKMGNGLDSDVGEGGAMLSTGERQLLSFARALLADPRILVLDEATSSVDTMTEKNIQQAIETVTRGRTSFMIAHRLSTVVDADTILCVKDGKIVERGTHKELMDQKGYYWELFTRQYEGMTVDMAAGKEDNE